MLTKNGRLALASLQTHETVSLQARNGGYDSQDYEKIYNSLTPKTSNYGSDQGVHLDLSDDTGAVTENTYTLNNYINMSNMAITTATRTINSRGQIVYAFGGTNTYTSSITIKKIGLRMKLNSWDQNDNNCYIVAENITPRVVQPGETYSFTIVI